MSKPAGHALANIRVVDTLRSTLLSCGGREQWEKRIKAKGTVKGAGGEYTRSWKIKERVILKKYQKSRCDDCLSVIVRPQRYPQGLLRWSVPSLGICSPLLLLGNTHDYSSQTVDTLLKKKTKTTMITFLVSRPPLSNKVRDVLHLGRQGVFLQILQNF